MIKALFFDLDGTLLNSQKRIPSSVRDALLDCRRHGVKVFFATARSPRLDQTLGWSADEFALFDGGIYANGACVHFEGHEVYRYIDPIAVERCIQQANLFSDVHYSLHMPKDGYAFNFPVEPCMTQSWGLAQARICPISQEVIRQTVKLLIFYDHLTDSQRKLPCALTAGVREACSGLANVYLTDEGRTIQLSGAGVGKCNAIEAIRQKLQLTVEETAVFGDDVNDLEMIAFYPNSVAMGNAVVSVKKAAAFVTRENDADGVSYALGHLLPMA